MCEAAVTQCVGGCFVLVEGAIGRGTEARRANNEIVVRKSRVKQTWSTHQPWNTNPNLNEEEKKENRDKPFLALVNRWMYSVPVPLSHWILGTAWKVSNCTSAKVTRGQSFVCGFLSGRVTASTTSQKE